MLVAFDNLVGQPFPDPYDLVSKARIALSRFIIGDSRYTGGTLLVGVTIKIARSARNSFEDLRGNVWAESGPEIWSIEIVDTLCTFVLPIFLLLVENKFEIAYLSAPILILITDKIVRFLCEV